MAELLEQFVREECTADVRRLLEGALADRATQRHRFELNRFEVTVEHDAEVVVIEDVLDATEAGVVRVSIAELAEALGGWSQRSSARGEEER